MCFYGFSNLNSSSVDVVASPRGEQWSRHASPRTRAASSSIDAASSLNFFCGSPVHGALCAHARLRLLHASPDPRELPAAALKQLAQKGQGRSIKKGCCTPHALTSGQGSTSTPSRAAAKLMTISSSLYFQTFFTLLQSVSLCYYSVKSIFESFCSDNAVFRQLRHLERRRCQRELTRFVARSTISGADRTFFHQSGYAFSQICKVMFFVSDAVGINYNFEIILGKFTHEKILASMLRIIMR